MTKYNSPLDLRSTYWIANTIVIIDNNVRYLSFIKCLPGFI